MRTQVKTCILATSGLVAIMTTRPVIAKGQGSEKIASTVTATSRERITREVLSPILVRFGVTATRLSELLDIVTPLLNAPSVPEQVVVDQLLRFGVNERVAVGAAAALVSISQGNASSIARKELGDFLFTYAAASFGSDRALTTSTLVEFVQGPMAVRVITAAAVSNPDEDTTLPPGVTDDLFRTRTADLLTMLQVGGNAVLRLHFDIRNPADPVSGAFTIDGGMMGDWLNANTDSRYTLGASLQGRWVLGTLADPVRLIMLGRGGFRWAKAGILTGDPDNKTFSFGTGSLEFHLPNGKIPFGISFNTVFDRKIFGDYIQPIHVYTTLTR